MRASGYGWKPPDPRHRLMVMCLMLAWAVTVMLWAIAIVALTPSSAWNDRLFSSVAGVIYAYIGLRYLGRVIRRR